MNCTRVLLPCSSGLSADMAMRLCFASSPPISSFLGGYDTPRVSAPARCKANASSANASSANASSANASSGSKPLRPCLLSSGPVGGAVSSADSSTDTSSPVGGAVATDSTATSPPSTRAALQSSSSLRRQNKHHQKKKKSVVWSDWNGLALTSVHHFTQFTTDPLPFSLEEIEGAAAALRLSEQQAPDVPQQPSLTLGFPQPAADYLDFRNRLKTQRVCLENCQVTGCSLVGTVKVRNISFQKKVFLRVTFDLWSSSHDLSCSFMNNVYGCEETDTFSFNMDLSEASQQVEFCVCFEAANQTFWDNNGGKNYCLLANDSEAEGTGGSAPVEIRREGGASDCRPEMAFDPFGSPRTSAGIFPEWQSWGRIDGTTAPYW